MTFVRYIYFGNNRLGRDILQWLESRGEGPVALVIHPEEKQNFGEDLKHTFSGPVEHIFDGSKLQQPETYDQISHLGADFGISVLFDYIFQPEFIELFPEGIINLHPSYLPYNRGQYPNVWSIVDETPAGVSLHYIDESIDTGDIIAREKVNKEPIDTGKRLYRKLEQAGFELFKNYWRQIKQGEVEAVPQQEEGTYHKKDDVTQIDQIDLDKKYRARDLINILRARTFPPYESAYFKQNGKKVYIEVDLQYGDEAS